MERNSCELSMAFAASCRIALRCAMCENCKEKEKNLQNVCISCLSSPPLIQPMEQRNYQRASKQQTLSHLLVGLPLTRQQQLLSDSFAKYLPSSPRARIVKKKREEKEGR